MSTTIQIKRSSTASAVPLSGDLAVGELAVNLADKRLFAKQADGTIIELSTNPTDLDAATLRIDGVEITASATELNSLDGLTATTAELNILDGVTATTAELNFVDGVTSNVQTQLNAKQPLDTQLTDIAGLTPTDGSFIVGNGVNFVAESGNTAIASLGVTATAAELNILDGVTATTAELNITDGLTATTTELNTLDGITATTTELNYTDGVTSNIQTQLNSKAATTTSPTITLAGDLSGSATLTNLGNATLTATVADDSHNHVISNVDGLQTALDSKANLSGANFTGSVDVTGTITADGLVVDGEFISDKPRSDTAGEGFLTIEQSVGTTNKWAHRFDFGRNYNFDHYDGSTWGTHLTIGSNGDVSFYEDTGTTAKMVWDASAESLGIGKTPNYTLDIAGRAGFGVPNTTLPALGADTANFRIGNLTGGTINYGTMFGTLGTGDGYIQQQRFDGNAGAYNLLLQPNAGNVGIGTASPSRPLSVQSTSTTMLGEFKNPNNTKSFISFANSASSADQVRIGSDSSSLVLSTNYTERARIDSSGRLLVGKTSSAVGSAGVELQSGAGENAAIIGTASVQPLILNRLSTDGDIAQFRKDGSTVGSIGVNYGQLYIGTGDTGLNFDSTDETILPHNTTTNAQRDSAVNLGRSTSRFKDLYLSGGVYLGGTGAANKLDDYETGTFTPTAFGASTAGTGTYTSQSGRYTKIGNKVFIEIVLGWSAHTGTGRLQINGLPFNTNGVRQAFEAVTEGLTYSGIPKVLNFGTNNSVLQFFSQNSNGGLGLISVDSSVSYLVISGSYETTA